MQTEIINGYDADGKTPNRAAAQADPRGVDWPAGTSAVVLRDTDGTVKAFAAVIVLPHIEGLWVAENARHSSIPAHFVKALEDIIRNNGLSHVWTFANDADPKFKTYLDRFHYERMPFSVYMKDLGAG